MTVVEINIVPRRCPLRDTFAFKQHAITQPMQLRDRIKVNGIRYSVVRFARAALQKFYRFRNLTRLEPARTNERTNVRASERASDASRTTAISAAGVDQLSLRAYPLWTSKAHSLSWKKKLQPEIFSLVATEFANPIGSIILGCRIRHPIALTSTIHTGCNDAPRRCNPLALCPVIGKNRKGERERRRGKK